MLSAGTFLCGTLLTKDLIHKYINKNSRKKPEPNTVQNICKNTKLRPKKKWYFIY